MIYHCWVVGEGIKDQPFEASNAQEAAMQYASMVRSREAFMYEARRPLTVAVRVIGGIELECFRCQPVVQASVTAAPIPPPQQIGVIVQQ